MPLVHRKGCWEHVLFVVKICFFNAGRGGPHLQSEAGKQFKMTPYCSGSSSLTRTTYILQVTISKSSDPSSIPVTNVAEN